MGYREGEISVHWTPALRRLCAKDFAICLCGSSGRGNAHPRLNREHPGALWISMTCPRSHSEGGEEKGSSSVLSSPQSLLLLLPCLPHPNLTQHLTIRSLTYEGNGHPQKLHIYVFLKKDSFLISICYTLKYEIDIRRTEIAAEKTHEMEHNLKKREMTPCHVFPGRWALVFVQLMLPCMCHIVPYFFLSKLCHKHFLCCFKLPVNIWQYSLHQSEWVYLTNLLYRIFNSFPFFFQYSILNIPWQMKVHVAAAPGFITTHSTSCHTSIRQRREGQERQPSTCHVLSWHCLT